MFAVYRFPYKAFLLIAAVVIFSAAILVLSVGTITRGEEKPHAAKFSAKADSYSILVDTEEKKLYLLNNGKLAKSYFCAVGTYETPSPLGSYKIISKSRWGEGFGGYFLGINCPWGNYGIHGTLEPGSIGYPASHGCIRMYNSDVEKLYETVPYGTRVVITGGCYGPFGDGSRIIEPGMYGLDVLTVQNRLKKLGYYNGYCSGTYDSPDFKMAVHDFQKENGLYISDYIGEKTLKKMGFVLMD